MISKCCGEQEKFVMATWELGSLSKIRSLSVGALQSVEEANAPSSICLYQISVREAATADAFTLLKVSNTFTNNTASSSI